MMNKNKMFNLVPKMSVLNIIIISRYHILNDCFIADKNSYKFKSIVVTKV